MINRETENKIKRIMKDVSEWLHRNDMVECLYCRKKLKRKDACIHKVRNAVDYFHHDCFITVSRYQFSGVYCVNAYDKEGKDDK